MKSIYIHGLGQKADSWSEAAGQFDDSIQINLPELIQDQSAAYLALYSAFSKRCTAISDQEELVLVGLSLGSVLALHYAIDHPYKVKALVLIAAQYKMPKLLLKLQNAIFRFMPSSQFRQTGFQKADFITLCSSMADLDFSRQLSRIACPVLVICGQKDKANKKASMELAKRLPNAQYIEIANAGHEVNLEAPQDLAKILHSFFATL
ncbi:alpha/beta hydrolase [Erysipelotrichaceae bacterium RD49]|nr:alpha/beta hydrolase [Erysipelotrichaceae bacterium RD49]